MLRCVVREDLSYEMATDLINDMKQCLEWLDHHFIYTGQHYNLPPPRLQNPPKLAWSYLLCSYQQSTSASSQCHLAAVAAVAGLSTTRLCMLHSYERAVSHAQLMLLGGKQCSKHTTLAEYCSGACRGEIEVTEGQVSPQAPSQTPWHWQQETPGCLLTCHCNQYVCKCYSIWRSDNGSRMQGK